MKNAELYLYTQHQIRFEGLSAGDISKIANVLEEVGKLSSVDSKDARVVVDGNMGTVYADIDNEILESPWNDGRGVDFEGVISFDIADMSPKMAREAALLLREGSMQNIYDFDFDSSKSILAYSKGNSLVRLVNPEEEWEVAVARDGKVNRMYLLDDPDDLNMAYDEIVSDLLASPSPTFELNEKNITLIKQLADERNDSGTANFAHAILQMVQVEQTHDETAAAHLYQAFKNGEYELGDAESESFDRMLHSRLSKDIMAERAQVLRDERAASANAIFDLIDISGDDQAKLSIALQTVLDDPNAENIKLVLNGVNQSCYAMATSEGEDKRYSVNLSDFYVSEVLTNLVREFDLGGFTREQLETIAVMMDKGFRGDIIDFDFYFNPEFVGVGDKVLLQNDINQTAVISNNGCDALRVYNIHSKMGAFSLAATYEELKDGLYNDEIPHDESLYAPISAVMAHHNDSKAAQLSSALEQYYDGVTRGIDDKELAAYAKVSVNSFIKGGQRDEATAFGKATGHEDIVKEALKTKNKDAKEM